MVFSGGLVKPGFLRTAAILLSFIVGALLPQGHELAWLIRWLIMGMLFLLLFAWPLRWRRKTPFHAPYISGSLLLSIIAQTPHPSAPNRGANEIAASTNLTRFKNVVAA